MWFCGLHWQHLQLALIMASGSSTQRTLDWSASYCLRGMTQVSFPLCGLYPLSTFLSQPCNVCDSGLVSVHPGIARSQIWLQVTPKMQPPCMSSSFPSTNLDKCRGLHQVRLQAEKPVPNVVTSSWISWMRLWKRLMLPRSDKSIITPVSFLSFA